MRVRSRPLIRAAVAFTAGMLIATGATAKPPEVRRSVDYYDYEFDDDHMVGDTLASPPPILTGPRKPLRVLLIRPRASFVDEMLKSVEIL